MISVLRGPQVVFEDLWQSLLKVNSAGRDRQTPLHQSSIFAHPVEHGRLVGQQVLGRIELDLLSLSQDQDLGVVEDGVEPVRDGDDGALGELGLDGRLDQRVSLEVHGRGRLIQDQDFGLA